MSDIPSELHREILLHLPAEPLLRFRTVCKSWRRTIDDPSFARCHFINNQRSSPDLLIRSNNDGIFYSLPLDSLIHINGEQTIDATSVNYLVRQDVPRVHDFPVPTCDGLILSGNKTWVIWNPFTGDIHELPILDIELKLKGYGIGYDSASEDYKVVLVGNVSGDGESVYRSFVYSLRLNSWKTIMDCPLAIVNEGTFLNGALHWRSFPKITVLDLATEKYHQLSPPPPERGFPYNMRISLLDGCLMLCVFGYSQSVRVWVMKDYGTESWVELFSSVERHVINGWLTVWDWPIAYSNTQRQLVLHHKNEIIVWDIEKGSAKIVTIHGLLSPIDSQVFPRNIFRFNYSDGGVKRKTIEANTRLKLSVTTTTDIPCHSVSDDSSWEEEGEEEEED